jgi:hypothetical protein
MFLVKRPTSALISISSSPKLNLVVVDGGSLIFPSDSDPDHHRKFTANIIFVKDGTFEAGTEDEPYTSKLTITMTGTKESPAIPTYGNKVIGVRGGSIDIHGVKRDYTWTSLDSTAS